MKLFVALLAIALIAKIAYAIFTKLDKKAKKGSRSKLVNRATVLTTIIVAILLGLLIAIMYRDTTALDLQCSKAHLTTSQPPSKLQSATDYFNQGNYDYDTGNCRQAIADYTTAIKLDPTQAQTYNNRAYTYMRLRDYASALPDLNTAITLNPDYINALKNRGDLYNFYYQIDHQKAIADYDRVVALRMGDRGVCGHLAMAKTNNFIPLAFLNLFTNFSCEK